MTTNPTLQIRHFIILIESNSFIYERDFPILENKWKSIAVSGQVIPLESVVVFLNENDNKFYFVICMDCQNVTYRQNALE